jgi:cobaltochelatase CobT
VIDHLTFEEDEDGNQKECGKEKCGKEKSREENRGEEIINAEVLPICKSECRDRDEGDEERNAEIRPQRQEGHRSEAGNRYRVIEGTEGWEESPGEKILDQASFIRRVGGFPGLKIQTWGTQR